MCKFVVIDSFGNSRIVEAVDMFEAVEEAWNNHTGYTHIESITRIPTDIESITRIPTEES